MAKLKKIRSGNFTMISNAVFSDWRLSYKEIGIYCNMMMFPDNWDFTIDYMAMIHKDKKDAVRHGIDKLLQLGYITRGEKQNHVYKGKFGKYDYLIYEDPHDNPAYIECPKKGQGISCEPVLQPQLDFPTTENPTTENPTTENPMTGKPMTENPMSGNPTQYKTISNNTIYSKTINSNEEEDMYISARVHANIELIKNKLFDSYSSIYEDAIEEGAKIEELNRAYNALLYAVSDISQPALIKAIDISPDGYWGSFLRWLYLNFFYTGLGKVIRSDVEDLHAYLVTVIQNQMKKWDQTSPLDFYWQSV